MKFKAEQGIAGIALYMLGWGIAGMLFRVYIGGTTSIVGLKAINFPLLTDIPVLGPILFSHNIMVYITLLFSLAHSFQRSIQVYGIDFPYEVAVVFPYLLVIVVLALSGRSKTMAPAVLGRPYYRELRD